MLACWHHLRIPHNLTGDRTLSSRLRYPANPKSGDGCRAAIPMHTQKNKANDSSYAPVRAARKASRDYPFEGGNRFAEDYL